MKGLTVLWLRVWQFLCDAIFPPSSDELRVRALTPEKLERLLTVPHARAVETLFTYAQRDIRALLWQLKYKNDPRAARLLGNALRTHALAHINTPFVLLPIPLSSARERERGYNQMTLVSVHAVRDLPHATVAPHILRRIRHTTPQTTLSRYERLKNMHGAFLVPDPSLVKGQDIVLIDDVTTTGTTLREAQETLLAAGARSVRCVALAH